MWTLRCQLVCSLLLAFVVVATLPVSADDPPLPKDGPTGLLAGPASPNAGLFMEDVNDPAFQKYVDLGMLGQAWSEQDAALMTDIALQLAEGERVLHRSHRAMASKDVFKTASQLAADLKDTATLKRLERSAKLRGDAELGALVASLSKLAATSRDPSDDVRFSMKDVERGADALFTDYVVQNRSARLAGDKKSFEKLKSQISVEELLTAPQKGRLLTQLEESVEGIGAPNPTISLMEKLAATSRDDVTNSWNNEDIAGESSVFVPPAQKPKPRKVSFSVVNYCPFDVRVQIYPGGQPFFFKAKKMFNGSWTTGDGSQPTITILATGKVWKLNTGRYQLVQGADGTPNWSLR